MNTRDSIEAAKDSLELVLAVIMAALPVGIGLSGVSLMFLMPMSVQQNSPIMEQHVALIALVICFLGTWVTALVLFGIVERVMVMIKGEEEGKGNGGTRKVVIRNSHGHRSIKLRKRR